MNSARCLAKLAPSSTSHISLPSYLVDYNTYSSTFLLPLCAPSNTIFSPFRVPLQGTPKTHSAHAHARRNLVFALNEFNSKFVLGKWPKWRTILYYVFNFIFIFNSLHVSSTSCSSSGETNCVNTTSGNCHCLLSVAVPEVGGGGGPPPRAPQGGRPGRCADRQTPPPSPTPRPPTQSDSYQRVYWHNLSLLMMSTMCSKHVES
jgi:hypothetical protein